ncbi:hypothetical protein OG689_44685 [Kitasatospora sp. NBC_00240]|uniref:hypothetical protein n=1 Tax=Kitasatospora sp. NBC_00240 TaxID=2903567 RepID=UPI00224F206E|nr:hypothetical protein [Kitasatospora sp. NBC_00240]MCX5216237.1 hypothetical protein [Kitasatospora sp. NBC_00240]
MSYDPEAGTGRHRKPRPPMPPGPPGPPVALDWSCRCGQHPDPDDGGPTIPPCVPPPPRPAPTPLPPEGRRPARHRRPRLDDPVPEGVVSLHEARNRKRYRDYMQQAGG